MSIAYATEYAQTSETDRKKVWPKARQKLVEKYGWGIPTESTISQISAVAQTHPIFDIGAGTGYISWLVQNHGGDVIPIDISPPRNTWTRVYQMDFTDLIADRVHSVLLVWPPARSPVAVECLNTLSPQTVFFIGYPDSTVTGDPDFHAQLEVMSCTYEEKLPSWGDGSANAVFRKYISHE